MKHIQHIKEPPRLWLVWQPGFGASRPRTRRIVGEILPGEGGTFRYFDNTEEFLRAREEGFEGYPAFKLSHAEYRHNQNVLDAFLRRLAPRSRDDFADYLRMYRLPIPFPGSDFALLGYTGARLPGDGFEIVPDLSNAEPPFELLIEIAGFRHQTDISLDQIAVGQKVTFLPDPENVTDDQAIAVFHELGRIGFVPRPYCSSMHGWLARHRVDAQIERINGKTDRPLIYLFVQVLPK